MHTLYNIYYVFFLIFSLVFFSSSYRVNRAIVGETTITRYKFIPLYLYYMIYFLRRRKLRDSHGLVSFYTEYYSRLKWFLSKQIRNGVYIGLI